VRNIAPLLALTAVIGMLLMGGFVLWTQDTRRGTVHAEYSVRRTDDRGAALVFRLFEDRGLRPQVWDREFTDLKGPGVLILLAPAQPAELLQPSKGDILPHEIEALDAWVKQGNAVVILARGANDLYYALGLILDEPESISGDPAEPVQPSLLARGVKEIQTQTNFGFKFGRQKGLVEQALQTEPLPAPIPEIPADQWVTLFAKTADGRSVPQVVSAARGKGLYVAVNDVFPGGNLGLPMADDARFMLNMARLNPRGGTIWFDEYHKRPVDRNLIAYLRERSLAPAMLYGLLLLGLLFWRTGSRFGAPEPLVADRRRDSAEYVRAVATLYKNAGMPKDALATIYGDFRRRLTGALRMDGLTDLDEVGRRYEMRTGRPALEARQTLIETEAALAREQLTEADALAFCERLTQLDNALHARKAANRRAEKPGGAEHGRHRGR
jgi:hypothetical protein